MTPIRIFEGAFNGATVYSNPGSLLVLLHIRMTHLKLLEFVTPTAIRSLLRQKKGDKYNSRKDSQEESARRKELRRREEEVLAVSKVFA